MSIDILIAADQVKYTVLVLLDLTTALDTVDHNILKNCLQNVIALSGLVLHWFSSYFTDKSYCVAANHFIFISVPLSCRVSQGSVSVCLLFLLYTAPHLQIIQQFTHVSYLFYADYVQVYCTFSESEFHLLLSVRVLTNNYLD